MRKDCKTCSKWKKHFYWCYLNQNKISFCKKMGVSFMKKMDLPTDFRRNFKGRIGENVELKGPTGNLWRVGVIKSSEKFTFRSGWKNFVLANNVEADDLLVFKYRGNSSFQVQIFGSDGCERTSLLPQIKVQESHDSSIAVFEAPDRNVHQDKIIISGSSSDSEYSADSVPVKMSDSSSDSEYSNHRAPVKVRRGQSSRRGTSKESNDRFKFKARINDQITFPASLFLSPAQEERVLQLSERIQPENHCFGTVMTLIMKDGKYRHVVPAKFASKHLPRHAKKAIFHYKGRTWSLPILYRGPRPYLSATGWRPFAKDNSLEEGTICVFELVMKNKETVTFKVHICRN